MKDRVIHDLIIQIKYQAHTHLAEQVLRQRLAGHPGVHGVELGVAVGQLNTPRRQQLPAGELQLVVMHVADISHVVANQVVEVALVLQGHV